MADLVMPSTLRRMLTTTTLFIEPGSPWENGYVESFNGKLRDELLSGELFNALREAQILVADWHRLRVSGDLPQPDSASQLAGDTHADRVRAAPRRGGRCSMTLISLVHRIGGRSSGPLNGGRSRDVPQTRRINDNGPRITAFL